MNTKPGRPKSTQEDREQKAFNEMYYFQKKFRDQKKSL